jgi:hypothetical protein
LPVITPDYRDTVEALVQQRHAIAVRRQSLLRAASLRRSPSHPEG